MGGNAEPAAVHIILAFDHLLGVGPAHGIGGADGRFIARADPVHMVAGLLPVDAFLKNGGTLTDLQNIHDRIGIEQILTAADRATGHIGGHLHNGFHLRGLFERRGVHRITALADVVGFLFTTHRLDGHRLGNQCGGGQIPLMAKALNVGPARVGDHLDIGIIHRADKAVETADQIASRLIEGTLGKVLQQRIETFGSGKGELVFGDRGNRNPAAGQRAQQVAQIQIGFFLHRRRDIAGLPVEFVNRHHLALGHVVGKRQAGGVGGLQGQHPFLALGGGFTCGRIDQRRVLRVAVIVFEQLGIDIVRTAGGGGIIGQGGSGDRFHMAVDIDHARRQGEHVILYRDIETAQNRSFLEKDIGNLAALEVDQFLLFIELGIEQIPVLMIADAFVVLGGIECIS